MTDSTAAILTVVKAIRRSLQLLHEKVDTLTSQSDDLAADVTTIEDGVTALGDAAAAIQAEIDALKNANPTLDLTALDAAVAQLTPAVSAISAIGTPPPAAPAS